MSEATLQLRVRHAKCGHSTVVDVPSGRRPGATLALVCSGCGELFEEQVDDAADRSADAANGADGASQGNGANGLPPGAAEHARPTAAPSARPRRRTRIALAGAGVLAIGIAGGVLTMALIGGGGEGVRQWTEAPVGERSSDGVYVPRPSVGDNTRYVFRRFQFDVPRSWRVSSGRVPVRVRSHGGVAAAIWWRRAVPLRKLAASAQHGLRKRHPGTTVTNTPVRLTGATKARLLGLRFSTGGFGVQQRVVLATVGGRSFYFVLRVPDPSPQAQMLGVRLLKRSFRLRP